MMSGQDFSILFDRNSAVDSMQLHIDFLEELTLGSEVIRRYEVG
jgi:hypothetical protein